MINENSSFLQLVKGRRSVRRFADKPVPREIIEQCIEAARLAPSAENVQPWRFLVLDDPEKKQAFCEQNFTGLYRVTRWAEKAPVIVVMMGKLDVLANRIGKQITGLNYYLIDLGIAGEHFVLQAQELGVGTCWIGWFSPRKVRKSLKLARGFKPVALFAMGYAADGAVRPLKRRSQEEICWYNEI
jgi:nitroreductase